MTTTAALLEPIRFARFYTSRLLEHTPPADAFRMPPAGVSHIGWQLGHLAMAAYRMGLERVRGRRPADERLISDEFLALFGRESVPDPSAGRYPPLEEIRAVYDRVHDQIQAELPGLPEADLDLPPLSKPHSLAKTRGACLAWCAAHEMVHAGQIGLLRRQLGHPPVW